MDILRRQLLADGAARGRRDRTRVSHDCAWLGAFDHAVRPGEHFLRHAGIADAHKYIVGLLGHLLWRIARHGFFFRRELFCFARRI